MLFCIKYVIWDICAKYMRYRGDNVRATAAVYIQIPTTANHSEIKWSRAYFTQSLAKHLIANFGAYVLFILSQHHQVLKISKFIYLQNFIIRSFHYINYTINPFLIGIHKCKLINFQFTGALNLNMYIDFKRHVLFIYTYVYITFK